MFSHFFKKRSPSNTPPRTKQTDKPSFGQTSSIRQIRIKTSCLNKMKPYLEVYEDFITPFQILIFSKMKYSIRTDFLQLNCLLSFKQF